MDWKGASGALLLSDNHGGKQAGLARGLPPRQAAVKLAGELWPGACLQPQPARQSTGGAEFQGVHTRQTTSSMAHPGLLGAGVVSGGREVYAGAGCSNLRGTKACGGQVMGRKRGSASEQLAPLACSRDEHRLHGKLITQVLTSGLGTCPDSSGDGAATGSTAGRTAAAGSGEGPGS